MGINMTLMIQTAFLIIVILVVRKIFGEKLHAYVRYGLWLLVVLRLLIPVNLIDSPWSISGVIETSAQKYGNGLYDKITVYRQKADHNNTDTPDGQTTSDTIVSDSQRSGPDDAGLAENAWENAGSGSMSENEGQADQNNMRPAGWFSNAADHEPETILEASGYSEWEDMAGKVFTIIWVIGSLLVGGFLGAVHLRFRCRLYRMRKIYRGSLLSKGTGRRKGNIPVYRVKQLESPCLVGLFHPAIYVGTDMKTGSDHFRYVVTHEQTHYLHKDHIWAFVRAVLVCIYWFHPFVWIAAAASARDGEIACDYGTVHRLGERERFSYGEMLLNLSRKSVGKRVYSYGTMLGSGKSEMKERIMRLMEPGSNRVSAGVFVVLLMAVLAGCAFTGRTDYQSQDEAVEIPEDSRPGKVLIMTNEGSKQDDSSENQDENIQGDGAIVSPKQVEAKEAQISEKLIFGADGPILDYAGNMGKNSGSVVIFHDYFGLVVYDLSNQSMIRSLDLEAIGCHMTQGDDACQVAVSGTGDTVWLHPMSKPYKYRYEVEKGLLYQEPLVKTFEVDLENEELFDRYLAVEETTQKYIGWRSNYLYEEYKDEMGVQTAYIYLYVPEEEGQELGNLQCVWNDMVFLFSWSQKKEAVQENAETSDRFPYRYEGNVVDVELTFDVPCTYSRISDTFGERTHPVTKEVIRHDGIDFAAKMGALVKAAADGTVYDTGYSEQYGYYVVLAHENGDLTYYCNCQSVAVEEDAHVKRGDTIAAVGSTGMSTGSHLHFALSRDGEFIDPKTYLLMD